VASNLSTDLKFWFYSSGWARTVSGQKQLNPKAQEKQQERDARITRVETFPNDVTIWVGDPLLISAIAYDKDNVPVGGVKFSWQSDIAGRDSKSIISPNGEFKAEAAGIYKITVEGAGKRAHATVRVRGTSNPHTGDPNNQSIRTISSRDLSAGTSSFTNSGRGQSKSAQRSSNHSKSVGASFSHSPKTKSSASNIFQSFIDGDPYGWKGSNLPSASSPINERSDKPNRVTAGGASSGNFQMSAPVVSLPGRGLDLNLDLIYRSRLWNKSGTEITYDIDHDPVAPGWSFGLSKVVNMIDNGALIIEADGTRHSFIGQLTKDLNDGTREFRGSTTDGSFIEYFCKTTGAGTDNISTWAIAKYPNGITILYSGLQSPSSPQNLYNLYVYSITDSNGNYISFTYDNYKIKTMTDTLGRVVTFNYDTNNLLTSITAAGLKDEAGNIITRTLVRLHYKTLTLDYGFTGLTPIVRSPTVSVIDAIYYPSTKTGYWFGDYDSYSSYGMIRKVSEQRDMSFSDSPLNEQGTISAGTTSYEKLYDYPLGRNDSLTDAPAYESVTESWANSDTAPSVTGFVVQRDSQTQTTTTTLPNQTKMVQYSYNLPGQYNNGLVYQTDTLDASNNLLQSTKTTWELGVSGAARPTQVTLTDERNQTRKTVYDYGEPAYHFFNQPKEIREYDYNGNLVRKILRQYQNYSYAVFNGNSNWANYRPRILGLLSSEEIYAADDTRVASTSYTYDDYDQMTVPGPVGPYNNPGNMVNAQGVVQHLFDFNPHSLPPFFCQWGRGNITHVTSYTDAANLSGPVTEQLTYDITGNVLAAVTSGGEKTSVVYNLDTQYSYPVSRTIGSTDPNSTARVTTTTTHDFNTGLGLSTADANSRATQVKYSTATWRPTEMISATGSKTTFTFNEVESSFTETVYTDAGVVAGKSVKLMNGRGQVRRVESLAGTALWDVVEIKYDKLGRQWKQTLPFRNGAAQNDLKWGETFYDALGRVSKVVAPDGSVSQNFYNEATRPQGASTFPGQTQRVVDPWQRERWGRFDVDGRLVEIIEPNPNGNGSVSTGGLITKYTYDTLGNVIEINQGVQRRLFNYDSLGRLTHQKVAEADATLDDGGNRVTNGTGSWSSVYTYDLRSNLASRTDARGAKTNFSYIDPNTNQTDPLNRLQSVSYETQGAQNVLPAATVRYAYMPSGDVTRVQRITTEGISFEDFDYDTEGRVKERKLTLLSRPDFPMIINYLYDSLNRLTDMYYPLQYGAGSAPRKIVHQDFDIAGRLSGLKVSGADYASSITYNAASQTTSLKVGPAGVNQINETYDYDPQTGSISNQKVVRGTGSSATTLLDLSYDYQRPNTTAGRTGQLTKITNNLDASRRKDRNYEYDALGRLVKATGGTAVSPIWTQSYSYDAYGNRLSVTASGNTAKLELPEEPKAQLPMVELAIKNDTQRPNEVFTSHSRTVSTSSRPEAEAKSATANTTAGSTTTSAPPVPQSTPVFTDDPLLPGETTVQAVHITELRTAIDQLRARAGLAAANWQETVSVGGLIRATPIQELRSRLDEALSALQLTTGGYSPGLSLGQPILAVHIQELRDRIKAAWTTTSTSVPRDGFSSLSYNETNNRINITGYEYDEAGNQTRAMRSDGTWQRFQYDVAGRLVKVKNDNNQTFATYTYGSSRRRLIAQDGIESSNQRTYYVWGAEGVIAEYMETDVSPTALIWLKNYIYLSSTLLATQEPGSSGELVQFQHPDRLGTRLVTSPANGTSFEQVTLAFGTSLDAESTGATNRQFTNYDRSAATGLDYALTRYYDPLQGRFTQVDTIGMQAASPTNPQSLNLYVYCGNDPINKIDPQGADWIWSPFPGTGSGGGSGGGGFWGGFFNFGIGLFGYIFGRRSSTHVLGSPFYTQPSLGPVPPMSQVPQTSITVALAGEYNTYYRDHINDNPLFKKRALFSVGNRPELIRQFKSGVELLTGAKELSHQVGPISRLFIMGHAYPAGFVGYWNRFNDDVNIGFYIDYPQHSAYRRWPYSLADRNNQGQAAGTTAMVSLILEEKINIATGGEIVLFGCNTDAMASHLASLLGKAGRTDIRVTGASGNVLFYVSPTHAEIDGPGNWNTYQGNGRDVPDWINTSRSKRRSYR
jgi:RHS repeat-associated protein